MAGINKVKAALILSEISIALNLEAAAILLQEENENKQRLHYHVKPRRKSRQIDGNIQHLLKEYNLYDDSKSYKSFLRMNEECFMEILRFVKADTERKDTTMRKCVPVEEKLAATLRFLATGESFKKVAENTKLSLAYLSSAIMEVCTAIYRNMRPKYLQFPDSKEKWLEVANAFERHWQFPTCLGALDGKHIAFKPRKARANLFYSSKGFTSIVLLAVADAYGKFLFIDVGCNGGISDGGVLNRSDLMSILENDELFPAAKVTQNNRILPYVIVAGNAFPLGRRLLTPYNKANSVKGNILFNRRLSRARQCIERAFSVMSNRFRIMQTQIQLDEEKTAIIVQACCVLHNFFIEKSFWYMQVPESENAVAETQNTLIHNVSNKSAEHIRNEYAQYFCNEGKL